MNMLPFLTGLLVLWHAAELERLQGTWQVVSLEANGQAVPEADFQKVDWTLTIRDDRFTLRAGALHVQGTFVIDPTRSPRRLDARGRGRQNDSYAMLGIYDFDGDKLRICYDVYAKARPTQFKTGGTNFILEVFRRQQR